MAIRYFPQNTRSLTVSTLPSTADLFMIGDTDAEKPVTGLQAGWRYFALDNDKLYKATDATTWEEIGAGTASGMSFKAPFLFMGG